MYNTHVLVKVLNILFKIQCKISTDIKQLFWRIPIRFILLNVYIYPIINKISGIALIVGTAELPEV